MARRGAPRRPRNPPSSRSRMALSQRAIANRIATRNRVLALASRPVVSGRAYRPEPFNIRHGRIGVPDAPPRTKVRRRVDRFVREAIPFRLAFLQPKRVWICVRRKMRRQVLFAQNLTGKGGRQRRRRRNELSNVRC